MFNPMIGAAMVAANNARVVTWQAQQRAKEQQDKLAALEAQVAVERQEHEWAIDLVHRGWSPSSAAAEAERETERRQLYPGLQRDLARMASRVPRVRGGQEFDAVIAGLERAIERRRAGMRVGPHPWLLGGLCAVLLIGGARLLAHRLAGPPLTFAMVTAALAGVLLGVFVARGSRGMWQRYRTSAQERADRRAESEIARLPGYRTWRYDSYMSEARTFWATQGNLGWACQRLSELGESAVDRFEYVKVHGRASALLDEVVTWESKLLFDAIDERLEAGDLSRAKALIGELTPRGQKAYKSQLQRLEAGKKVKESDLLNPGAPRLSLIEGQAGTTSRFANVATSGSSQTPSRVQAIGVHVDGDELLMSWEPPAQKANASTRYLISVKARDHYGSDVERFSVIGTRARFKARGIRGAARFEIFIEACNGEQTGPRSKSYFVALPQEARRGNAALGAGASS